MSHLSSPHMNILFITLDQWRGDCLSAVGHACVQTPHIDALAADSVLFKRHYTVTSPCGPARASLLTGLYLHNHRSVRNGIPLDSRHATLGQEASKLGYVPRLFGFTDTTLDPRGRDTADPALRTMASMAPGFSEGLHLPGDAWPWVEWLKGRGYNAPASPRDMWLPRGGKRTHIDDSPPVYMAEESETAFLTDAVANFIRQESKPWFAHVSYFRPHHPYIAPEPYNRMYNPGAIAPPVRASSIAEEATAHPWIDAQIRRQRAGNAPVQDKLDMAALGDKDIAQLRALYYGSVSECDDAIGRLITTLRETGQYDKTLIVLTSDHGDMLGDHWLWAAEGFFDGAFHVPLIIRDPSPAGRANAGSVVEHFTESVDIMPTILAAAGAQPPAFLDGHSLIPFLHGQAPTCWRDTCHWEFDFRDTLVTGLQAMLDLGADTSSLAVIRDTRYKYVHFTGLPPLFYAIDEDPHEMRDLSRDPHYISAMLDYAQQLLSWRLASDERGLTDRWISPDGLVIAA